MNVNDELLVEALEDAELNHEYFNPEDFGLQRGRSTVVRSKTALNHFNKFARHAGIPEFDAMGVADLARDTLGKFVYYLINNQRTQVKSYNTMVIYLSDMKG
jgi:hypothetical protein